MVAVTMTFRPTPHYLARFRRPMTEAEKDEVAKEFGQAIAAWLAEMDAEGPR
jgi:hypothetical protein